MERIKKLFNNEKFKNIIFIIMILLYPIFLNFIIEVIYHDSLFEVLGYINKYVSMLPYTINKISLIKLIGMWIIQIYIQYLIIIGLMLVLIGMFRKIRPAIIITTIIFTIFAIVNNVITQIRGVPFSLTDLVSLRTAINVVGNYHIKITFSFILSILLIIFYTILICLNKKSKIIIKKWIARVSMIAFGISILVVVINSSTMKELKYWNLVNAYKKNGQVKMIVRQILNLNDNSKPEGYSKETAKKILSNYKEDVKQYDEMPTVIAIMNESFADFKDTYNLSIKENLPYFKSLKEDTIRGNFYSPALGGGTANVEWEFLTNNTYAFMEPSTIPYVQYVKFHVDNFADIFRNKNYKTLAFHPYLASSYNRNIAYSYMGFSKLLFKDSFDTDEGFFDDKKTYEILLNEIDENDSKFNFVVTMQNHPPYDITKGETDDGKLNDYLKKVNKSDNALKYLIEQLEKKNKKIILLFFGDHQPGLALTSSVINGTEWNKEYIVPFIIWANYDIEEQEDLETSANYFNILLANNANLPKTSYMKFVEHVQEKIPVITANGYKGADGKIYQVDDKSSPYYDLIKEYRIVQYYEMYEKD